jgi:alpha-galactosidase/6-phospho-beta-glucosidase family protein
VNRIVDVQALTLKAALARDPELGFQAMLSDPLVRIPMESARTMYLAMLNHTKAYLPGWKIPAR